MNPDEPMRLLDFTNVIILSATFLACLWLAGALIDEDETMTEIVTKRDD